MEHPPTIRNPEAFDSSPAAGFDGIFDWRWTEGCFGATKIAPMDFDGVVERRCHYLVMETKDEGKAIPTGQLITLDNLATPRSFLVMKIWGKTMPMSYRWKHTLIDGTVLSQGEGYGHDNAINLVAGWYRWANGKL